MGAPAGSTRGTPAGIKFEDGFSTKLSFARLVTSSFWEKEVGPPGIDGGDPIEITTMHSVAWRTLAARHLKTLTQFTITAAWDPVFYNDCINTLINYPGSATMSFPDGSKIDFFAYLVKMEPQAMKEGEFPMVQLTVQPTNYDPVARVEAAPVLTLVSGT